MQPERADDRQAGVVRLTNRAYVGQQLVAEVEILAADRFHRRVVQLARVRIRRTAGVVGSLVGREVAGIPTPRQAQLPRAPMRAEERTERGKLKPADVELAGEFFRRDEAADVGAPVRNTAQGGVDRNRHVRSQRVPGRVDVTRPQKRRVALHSRMSVAVQREGALVRTPLTRSVPVHPIARQTRGRVEAVALVGPPTVDADVEQRFVRRPVAARLPVVRPLALRRAAAGQWRRRAAIGHTAFQSLAFEDDVQHDLEVIVVQLLNHARRIRKTFSLNPNSPLSVFQPEAEAGAEIDHRVARQLLLRNVWPPAESRRGWRAFDATVDSRATRAGACPESR